MPLLGSGCVHTALLEIRQAAQNLPFAKPDRPRGLERNIVLTLWDWSTPTGYMHDLISTDRRKPTVNAYGKLHGATEESTDYFPVLDPNTRNAGISIQLFSAPR